MTWDPDDITDEATALGTGGGPGYVPFAEVPGNWAELGRNPLGYQGQQRESGAVVVPARQERTIVRWTGAPMSAVPVQMLAAPDTTQQTAQVVFNPANALDVLITARVRWTLGVARFEAELDLIRSTIALTIPAANEAELSIFNGIAAGPDTAVKFVGTAGPARGASVSPEARKTRVETVPVVGTVDYAIPAWSREATPLWPAGTSFDVTFLDGKGVTIGAIVAQAAAGYGGTASRFVLPGGACIMRVSIGGLAAPTPVAIVFHLVLP